MSPTILAVVPAATKVGPSTPDSSAVPTGVTGGPEVVGACTADVGPEVDAGGGLVVVELACGTVVTAVLAEA